MSQRNTPPPSSAKHLDPTAAPYTPKESTTKKEAPAQRSKAAEDNSGKKEQKPKRDRRSRRSPVPATQEPPTAGGANTEEGGPKKEKKKGGDEKPRKNEGSQQQRGGQRDTKQQPPQQQQQTAAPGGGAAGPGENRDRKRDVGSLLEGASPLTKTIAQQLAASQYECMICTERIRHSTATWSCDTCFRIFHLSCAKKWADSDGSGEGTKFRCPGCQHQYDSRPKKYHCFCKKTVDPHNDGYSVPHSCGDFCNKKRKNGCPHACAEKCHPGPCPDCTIRVKPRSCPCGRTQYDFLCGKDDPKTTCKSICGKDLACGQHQCELPCHHGPCPTCKEETTDPCKCGKNTKPVLCGSEPWSCEEPCGETQRCGHCKCNVICHKGTCPPCDSDVQLITHCPCGQSPIPAGTRKSCQDPIPTCDSICGKVLACGNHYCEDKCHTGPCKPCNSKITIRCPCNSSTKKVQCTESGAYRCSQKCKTKLSCGRHECEVLCCFDKNKLGAHVHRCRRTCNKLHECGHPCGDDCHRGACPPCHQIVTTELSCNCGQEILYPPQPCGTEPPTCYRPCQLPMACGHEPVPHNCHFGPCPPCRKTVSKVCMGGHVEVKNVLCSVENVSCGNSCGKVLPCGHFCPLKCHAGPCLSEARTPQEAKKNQCQQTCGVVLPCGHSCGSKCHHGQDCAKCKTKVEISCECGACTRNIPCAEYQIKLAAVKRSSPKAEEEGLNASEQVEMHSKVTFPCTDDCAYQRRLNALSSMSGSGAAEAGGDRWGGLGGSSNKTQGRRTFYSIEAWSAARNDVDGIISIEKQLQSFISSGAADLMLPSMPRDKRLLVHELCWYHHLGCQSFDQEPQRSCFITRTPNTTAPNPMLSKAVYNDYENPNEIAKKIMMNRTEATNKTIVMEGDGLHIIAIHGLMKQFAGQMIIVPHETKDACFFLIFPWGGDMGTAYSYLRRQSLPSIHFYRYGDDPKGVGSGGGGTLQTAAAAPTAGGGVEAPVKKKAVKSWASMARDKKEKDKDTLDTRNAFGALRK